MAVPKNKVSKSKTNSRFANWKVSALNMSGTVKSVVKSVYRDGVLRFTPSTRNALIYHIEKIR